MHRVVLSVVVATMFAIIPTLFIVAWAQPVPAIPVTGKEVSGNYTNPDVKLEITLPDGWKGFVLNDLLNSTRTLTANTTAVFVFPNATSQNSIPDPSEGKDFMMIAILTKNITQGNTIPDSFRNPSSSTGNSTLNCKPSNSENVQINGMNGNSVVFECTSNGVPSKIKVNSFQSEQRLFIVEFAGSSTENYDKYVGAFDNSVKTLKIADTIAAPAIPEFPLSMVGIIAGLLGVVAFLGRTKLMKGSTKIA